MFSIKNVSICTLAAVVVATATAECIQLPNGTWQCQPTPTYTYPSEPAPQPTAMDIRVEGPTARGSGTAVARAASGGTLIVTNHHVVQGQSSIVLRNGSGQSSTARLVAQDQANDLVLLEVAQKWPFVKLGDDVSIGTPLQFRAFDAGVTFRKYYGQVKSGYQSPGSGGFFATGSSVPGNSGGGVYNDGQLVGVVWGNPNGGTAFVPVTCVRRLLDRVLVEEPATPAPTLTLPQRGRGPENPPPLGEGRVGEGARGESESEPPPTTQPAVPTSCDCEQHWQQIERQLAELAQQQREQPVATPQPTLPATTDLLGEIPWFKLVATLLGASSPIGVAIVAAGWLLRRKHSQATRGSGGPRAEDFRDSTDG